MTTSDGFVKVGDTLKLTANLKTSDTGLYPRWVLYNPGGSTYATVNLSHVATGYYADFGTTMPDKEYLYGRLIIYTDASHTIESTSYLPSERIWTRDDNADQASVDVVDGIVDDILVDTNEIQGKLPTNNIMGSSDTDDHDTDIDSILADTNEMQGKLPTNNIMGSSVKTDKDDEIDAILADTDEMQGKLPTNNIMGSSVKTDKDDEIDAILADTADMQPKIAGMETQQDSMDSQLDDIESKVGSIQNNTRFVGVVPEVLKLPSAGTKDYRFFAQLFDTDGNPEDPDSNTLNINIQTVAGATVVATTPMTRNAVGDYSYDYTVNSSDTEQPLVVIFTYDENSIAFTQYRTTEVKEFESTLDDIQTTVDAILVDTDEMQGKLPTNNIMGSSDKSDKDDEIDAILADTADMQPRVSGIETQQDSMDTQLNTIEGKVDTVDGVVDSILVDTNEMQGKLPTNNIMGSAVKTDKDDEIDAILADTADMQPRVAGIEIQQDAMDTQLDTIEDKIDTIDTVVDGIVTSIAALNDLSIADVQTALTSQGYTSARATLLNNLSNLDATISSIATLIGALNDIGIADVQTALTNQGYTSLRAALLDNLDATISSIATLIGALNDLGVADIYTAVWDRVLPGNHDTANTAGKILQDVESGMIDTGAIADAVWDELISEHSTSGSFAAVLSSILNNTAGAGAVTGFVESNNEVIGKIDSSVDLIGRVDESPDVSGQVDGDIEVSELVDGGVEVSGQVEG